MVAGLMRAEPSGSLRTVLKQRTRPLHDKLDAMLGHAPLDSCGYVAFLGVQYASRAPIEAWAAVMAPEIRPPASAPLIAQDLASLGVPLPCEARFVWPAGADPLGVAWALAGSSLGNRALLHQRRKAGLEGPDRFLTDPAPVLYFQALLPRLAEAVPAARADAAARGAEAVFRTFLEAARAAELKAAA